MHEEKLKIEKLNFKVEMAVTRHERVWVSAGGTLRCREKEEKFAISGFSRKCNLSSDSTEQNPCLEHWLRSEQQKTKGRSGVSKNFRSMQPEPATELLANVFLS